jgi:hypothetical protein
VPVPVPEQTVGRLSGRLHCGNPRLVGPHIAGWLGSGQVATWRELVQFSATGAAGGVGDGVELGSTSACSSTSKTVGSLPRGFPDGRAAPLSASVGNQPAWNAPAFWAMITALFEPPGRSIPT